MNSRNFMNEEILLPKDLVTMVIEILPLLDLIQLERLLLLTEMEIQYRSDV